MAVDQTQSSPADSTVVPGPNIIPPDQSAGLDPNRPDSTISADSSAQPQPSLADSGSDYTEPPSTVPADSSQIPADSSQTSAADLDQAVPSIPADSTSQSADQSVTTPSSSTEPAPSSPAPSETPVEEATPSPEPVAPTAPAATSGGSKDSLPPDQPIQVQPEAPESAPSPQASQAPETAPQSAGIKPELLEDTQNAPLADSNSQKSSFAGYRPVSGFGDILVGVGRPNPAPSPVSQSQSSTPISEPPASTPLPPASPPITPVASKPPKSSFGDLMGKQPEEPTFNIEPIQPPKKEVDPVTPPNPSVPPIPSQPSADKLKTEVEARRQKATQIRKQKHDGHIVKTLSFVQQKGKVKNEDIRDYLHVSQTTATDYLHTLVKQGKIIKEGKGKATVYSLI